MLLGIGGYKSAIRSDLIMAEHIFSNVYVGEFEKTVHPVFQKDKE